MKEDHKEDADGFTGTIVRLMRLSREGKLDWKTEFGARGSFPRSAPSYIAEFGQLRFRLEDVSKTVDPSLAQEVARAARAIAGESVAPYYRLVIEDLDSGEKLTSPPLQAANDLASLIKQGHSSRLYDINRRLDLALGESGE